MTEKLRALIKANETNLIQAYRNFTDLPPPNNRGDRDIEYSWIAGRCPEGPGRGLDFGCGRSYMAMVAVRRGFNMLAIDLKPVQWRSLLVARGTMLLTIPVGRDAVFMPAHRVYGRQRLPRLLDGFDCLGREFWVKNEHNRWVPIDEDAALKRTPHRTSWGLGCFMLKRR